MIKDTLELVGGTLGHVSAEAEWVAGQRLEIMQSHGGRCMEQGWPRTKLRNGLTMRVAVRMRRVWCAGMHLTAGTGKATSAMHERRASCKGLLWEGESEAVGATTKVG